MAYWDSDVSGAISPEDTVDPEHYAYLVESCDEN
jgi:hypothetical protein